MGYLYNWAAAVGVEQGKLQTKAFTGNRQGICPNGWHMPTSTEWAALVNYIEVAEGKGSGQAGKHMKTTSGWYDNGSGLNTYGFAALPSGRFDDEKIGSVGGFGIFWSASFDEYSSSKAVTRGLFYYTNMLGNSEDSKMLGRAVRCIMNEQN